jgi:hypothetical protein
MNLINNQEDRKSINDCWKKVCRDVEAGDVPAKHNFIIWMAGYMLMAYLPENNDNPSLLTQQNMAQATDECQMMIAIGYHGGIPTASIVNCSKICAINVAVGVS